MLTAIVEARSYPSSEGAAALQAPIVASRSIEVAAHKGAATPSGDVQAVLPIRARDDRLEVEVVTVGIGEKVAIP